MTSEDSSYDKDSEKLRRAFILVRDVIHDIKPLNVGDHAISRLHEACKLVDQVQDRLGGSNVHCRACGQVTGNARSRICDSCKEQT